MSTDLEGIDSAVVFLDALGIKGIWKRKDPVKVLGSWRDLKKAFDKRCDYLTWTLNQNKTDKISFTAFSDTVIITLPIKERNFKLPNGLTNTSFTIGIMGELLTPVFRISIKLGFCLRGSISVGKIYKSNDIIIGPAIDEAAEYYKLPEWVGLSTAPSASLVLKETDKNADYLFDFFTNYDLPLKNRVEMKAWVLNWPKYLSSETETETEVQAILDEELRKNTGINEYFKIKNTIDFYDHIKSLDKS